MMNHWLSFVTSWRKAYHNRIKCPDFAEYAGVLGNVKNYGHEMAPQDVSSSFWRRYNRAYHINYQFECKAKGEPFKPVTKDALKVFFTYKHTDGNKTTMQLP
jgi:hypothetical protein